MLRLNFGLRRAPQCCARKVNPLPQLGQSSNSRILLSQGSRMYHSSAVLRHKCLPSSSTLFRGRTLHRINRTGFGSVSQILRNFQSTSLAAFPDGSSTVSDDTIVSWPRLREILADKLSGEELSEYDKLFEELPSEGMRFDQLREQVGKSLVLGAAGIDLEANETPESNELNFLKELLRKDGGLSDDAAQIDEGEAQLFSQFLVATLTGDVHSMMNKPDKETVDASLARFGIKSRRPISMIQEAVSSFVMRSDTMAHFEQWNEKAVALLEEKSIGKDASIKEIEDALRDAGLLDEAVETMPDFNPSLDADEAHYRSEARDNLIANTRKGDKKEDAIAERIRRDYYAYYLREGRLDEFKEIAFRGCDPEDEKVMSQMKEVEQTIKKYGPQIVGDEDSLQIDKLRDRLQAHISKNGPAELTRLTQAMVQMDTGYITDQGLLEDGKGAHEGADDCDKLWDESGYASAQSALEGDELEDALAKQKEHMEGPHATEGWILKEWMLWKEERGEPIEHDPADASSWLEVSELPLAGSDSGDEEREMHPMEMEDLYLHTTSRRQLRRVFELYEDVNAQAREIEAKRPADDILALRAQPPEFVGDARLRYAYRDYLYVQSHELETHPGQRTVHLKVNLHHLPLDETEKQVVKELTGPRYNAASGDVTFTSRKFAHRLHNRIHVRLLLDRVIQEAKRSAQSSQ